MISTRNGMDYHYDEKDGSTPDPAAVADDNDGHEKGEKDAKLCVCACVCDKIKTTLKQRVHVGLGIFNPHHTHMN